MCDIKYSNIKISHLLLLAWTRILVDAGNDGVVKEAIAVDNLEVAVDVDDDVVVVDGVETIVMVLVACFKSEVAFVSPERILAGEVIIFCL